MTILRVALPVRVNQVFDYLCPDHLPVPEAGARVRVTLGRRKVVGVVTDQAERSAVPAHRLKTVDAVLDTAPLFPSELYSLCLRVAAYYHHPLGEVLATALPSWLRSGRPARREPHWAWRLTEAGLSISVESLRRAVRQRRVLEALAEGPVAESELIAQPGVDRRLLARLVEKGWLERRVLEPGSPSPGDPGPALNQGQRAAVDAVSASMGQFSAFLLDGITGSGKTEVYLTLAGEALDSGRQALVIVPEIGLTPQLMRRFRRRLGERVGVLHSALPDGERAALWLAARAGEVDVVLGTRSAVWVPLARPGLIVVDEEHDGSLKQQDGLRYSARDVAVLRAQGAQVPAILGSATPSLESLHNVHCERYRHLVLPRRAGGARPPALNVVDLRGLRDSEGLSPALSANMDEALGRGEQVLLFLNRRGYSPVLMCQACGWTAECTRCDSRLTLHRSEGALRCHHCDRRRPVPPRCPDCRSTLLEPLGLGTQRLEQDVKARFPDVRVMRLDRDTTQRRDAWPEVLAQLASGEPCILLGTQMLAKGHDYPNITLVGVINLDSTLFSSDFRATERAAQLLIQVAGRAGRAGKPGQVMVQTRHPEHPLFSELLAEGYRSFAEQLLIERAAAGYPPIGKMALLRAEATDPERASSFLEQAVAVAGSPQSVQVLGPMPAPMARRGGRHRLQVLLTSRHRRALHRFLDLWVQGLYQLPGASRVRWSLDVDPADHF